MAPPGAPDPAHLAFLLNTCAGFRLYLERKSRPIPPVLSLSICLLRLAVRDLEAPERATTWMGRRISCGCAVAGCRGTGVAEFFRADRRGHYQPVGVCDRHSERVRFELTADRRTMQPVDLFAQALPRGWRSAVHPRRRRAIAAAGDFPGDEPLDEVAGVWLLHLLPQGIKSRELAPSTEAKSPLLTPLYKTARRIRNKVGEEVSATALPGGHRTKSWEQEIPPRGSADAAHRHPLEALEAQDAAQRTLERLGELLTPAERETVVLMATHRVAGLSRNAAAKRVAEETGQAHGTVRELFRRASAKYEDIRDSE